MSEPLTKVDSAVQGLSSSPPKEGVKHRRASSSATGVMHIDELEKEKKEIRVAPETQRLGWKINTSPTKIDDKEYLKKMLTEPPVRRIDLHFIAGGQVTGEVTARNLKGVTIKDALDAIHKRYKKRADDELPEPYLKGFEWDPEEDWKSLIVHLSKDAGVSMGGGGGKKKKNKGGDE